MWVCFVYNAGLYIFCSIYVSLRSIEPLPWSKIISVCVVCSLSKTSDVWAHCWAAAKAWKEVISISISISSIGGRNNFTHNKCGTSEEAAMKPNSWFSFSLVRLFFSSHLLNCRALLWKRFSRENLTSVCCYRSPQIFSFDRHICCELKFHLILFIFFICSLFIQRKRHVWDERVRETVSSSRVNKIHISLRRTQRKWREQTRTRHSQILHNFYAIIYKHICLSACACEAFEGTWEIVYPVAKSICGFVFSPTFFSFVCSFKDFITQYFLSSEFSLFILCLALWLRIAAAFPQESWKFRTFILSIGFVILPRTPNTLYVCD